uniref:Uncharacterized protein n=1 Tax=Medicago truncatula TaxID=3880 RepID=Q2HSY5_MEDTR|nr:hypothetical protein MtrDRAFT_AC150889g17v2 [Medicago truncatula]
MPKSCLTSARHTHGPCASPHDRALLHFPVLAVFVIKHGRVLHQHDRARVAVRVSYYKLLVSTHYCHVMIV